LLKNVSPKHPEIENASKITIIQFVNVLALTFIFAPYYTNNELQHL